MSENDNNWSEVNEYLSHIRKIHFAFIILFATAAYIILPNWSNSSLKQEISDFRQLIHFAKRGQLDSVYSYARCHELEEQLKHQVDSIFDSRTTKLLNIYSYGCDFRAELMVIDTAASLESCRKRMINPMNDGREVKVDIWGIKYFDDNFADIQDYLRKADNEVDGEVLIGRVNPNYPGEQLKQQSIISISQRYGGIIRDTAFFKSYISFVETPVTFNNQWFASSYPELSKWWSKVAHKTFDEALVWSRNQTLEAVREKRINIFGLEFEGKDFGLVSAVLSLSLLVYLLLYMLEYNAFVHGSRPQIVPSSWIGTTKNTFGFWITVISLVFGWFITIPIPLWVLNESPITSIVFGVIGLTLTVFIVDVLYQVRNSRQDLFLKEMYGYIMHRIEGLKNLVRKSPNKNS